MSDFLTQMKSGTNLSEEKQIQAGTPIAGDMGQNQKGFVKQLALMIERKEIDPENSESFLNRKVYDSLEESIRGKIDIAMPNVARLLKHIIEFYQSKQTPDACPQLETMINQLWEMKERIEVHGDVFTF